MKKVLLMASVGGFYFLSIQPILAASFTFTSENGKLDGNLSFTSSPLKGIGIETINLSQLKNINFLYELLVNEPSQGNPPIIYGYSFTAPAFPYGSSGFINEPIFNFNNGVLTGMNFESTPQYGMLFLTEGASKKGDYSAIFNGNKYQTYFTGTFSSPNYVTGQIDTTVYQNQFLYSDNIIFTTVEKVQAIPEASTTIGLIALLGFGTFCRRVKS